MYVTAENCFIKPKFKHLKHHNLAIMAAITIFLRKMCI